MYASLIILKDLFASYSDIIATSCYLTRNSSSTAGNFEKLACVKTANYFGLPWFTRVICNYRDFSSDWYHQYWMAFSFPFCCFTYMEPQAVKLSQFSSSTCGNAVCTRSFFFPAAKSCIFHVTRHNLTWRRLKARWHCHDMSSDKNRVVWDYCDTQFNLGFFPLFATLSEMLLFKNQIQHVHRKKSYPWLDANTGDGGAIQATSPVEVGSFSSIIYDFKICQCFWHDHEVSTERLS